MLVHAKHGSFADLYRFVIWPNRLQNYIIVIQEALDTYWEANTPGKWIQTFLASKVNVEIFRN